MAGIDDDSVLSFLNGDFSIRSQNTGHLEVIGDGFSKQAEGFVVDWMFFEC